MKFFNTKTGFITKFSVGLSALSATLLASPSEAAIIKQIDFESGTFAGISRQFQDKTCSNQQSYIDNELFDIVQAPARGGKFALKHHVTNCDERSEVVIPRQVLEPNTEYWLGWSYLFPKNFFDPGDSTSTVMIVNQMQYEGVTLEQQAGTTLFECNKTIKKNGITVTSGAPTTDLLMSPDGKSYKYSLKFYKGKDAQGRNIFGCKNFALPAILEQWEDFVVNVKFSSNPNEGFLRLWKNDKLYVDEKVALLHPGVNTIGAWKFGAYTGNPGKGERILYTDEIKLGKNSSYLEVAPKGARQKIRTTAQRAGTLQAFALPVSANGVTVPEPNSIIGLLAFVGGFIALKRKPNS